MLKQFAVIVLFCCLTCSGGSLIIRDMENSQYDLVEYTQVALYMVTRFVSQRTNALIIMEKCEFTCEEHRVFHQTVLRDFLNNLNYTLTIQLFFEKQDNRPWDYNMFIVPSWWDFEALRVRFPETKQHRQFYFFIVLTWSMPNERFLYSQMIKIFELCLHFNVKNVVIMHKVYQQTHICFYTYQIFSPDHCHQQLTIQEINRYENGRLQHDFLFPDDMNNYHGCSLTVCGHILEPLLTFNGDLENESHLRDMQRLGGIEGEILKLVARTMNLKLEYRFPQELYRINMDMNSTGCFGDLEQHRAQVAIGGLNPLIKNSHKFSYSFAYHTTPYVFVVRGGVLFGPINQLLYPLNRSTWLVVLLQLLVAIAVIEIIERIRKPALRNFVFGPRNRYPKHNLFVALLGNPLPPDGVPRRNFARFLLMAWLLLTFELRNGYQGKMFDSLRLAKRRPIPVRISELLDLDYTLLTAVYTDLYPSNRTMLIRSAAQRLDLLNRSEQRLTTTALLDYLVNYNMRNWNTSSLAYINENIYFYQCVMFFKKYSILLSSFDRKLNQLSDAGITTYIARQHVQLHFRNMKGYFPSTDVGRITHQNLLCLYYIYVVMCSVAIFIFILEMVSRRLTLLKRLLDRFN